jgi:hypothetical protein
MRAQTPGELVDWCFVPIAPARSVPLIPYSGELLQPPVWNVRTRKVGGLRFVWVGRLCFSFCLTRSKN